MTAQIHERLILDGYETSMASCPPLPLEHPRLEENRENERSEDDPSDVYSTACWRHYVGTWEIRDGRFFLVDVRGRYRLLPGDPLFADWFSGVLRVPQGQLLQYVHMGFESVFEKDLFVTIERGIVVGSDLFDNR